MLSNETIVSVVKSSLILSVCLLVGSIVLVPALMAFLHTLGLI